MNQDRTSTTITNSQLKEGYKQIEVGIIPEDWSISTVGEEFSIQLGKMLDAEKNIGTPKPYLGNRAIQWGHIETDDIGLISLTPSDIQRFRLKKGDLLVCEGGESGRAAIWNNQINECYYQKALHRLRPTKGYNVFLMLCFLQRWVSTGFLADFITQTSIAHLPKEKFEQVPLLIPTLPEQEAIAHTLSDIDALIESLDRLLTKKRQIKQGAMQELLRSKEGWEKKRIGDVLNISHGRSQYEVVDENGDYPILASGGQIGRAKTYLYDKPSVLIGRKGTIDKPQYMDRPFWTVDTLFYSIIHEPNNAKYLFYQFCLIPWREYNEASGVPSLNARTIESIEITVPSPKEQIEIAHILSDMDAEIDSIESKLTKTRQLKQGMMHELLTGRIRLVDTSHGKS